MERVEGRKGLRLEGKMNRLTELLEGGSYQGGKEGEQVDGGDDGD